MSPSKRFDALIQRRTGRIPKVGKAYAGWYRAPNGQRYFGFGRVMEIGTTHDGGIYVNVEPQDSHPDSQEHTFFDPFTDTDMPPDQYPPDKIDREAKLRREEQEEWAARRKPPYLLGPGEHVKMWRGGRYPELTDLSRDKPDLKPGDMTYGSFMSARNLTHFGPGKIVGPIIGEDGKLSGWCVEPGRVRGVLPFFEIDSYKDIAVQDLPRSPYSGSVETQQRVDPGRPRREEESDCWSDAWIGGLPPMPDDWNDKYQPRLGSEHSGAYIAADGQWFAGVGRVVAVGFTWQTVDQREWYVYVEPIPGKAGGNYDFFHPVTLEWMDTLPENPIPGVSCSPKQRRSLPARWRNLPAIYKEPSLGEEYTGRFYPPNAPRRDVYIGVGTVVKTGVDSNKRIWVEVKPIAGKTTNGDPRYRFFDPWTGLDMPEDYYASEA